MTAKDNTPSKSWHNTGKPNGNILKVGILSCSKCWMFSRILARIQKPQGKSWLSTFNPFTPESDQCQNSPAASQEIWHHTVWRTWLFIATQMKSDYITNSRYITHTIAFWKVGRIHFLSSGVKGLKLLVYSQTNTTHTWKYFGRSPESFFL